jgi:VCBS repeat-containing protein
MFSQPSNLFESSGDSQDKRDGEINFETFFPSDGGEKKIQLGDSEGAVQANSESPNQPTLTDASETTETGRQLTEIDSLQQLILEDEAFDFGQLEPTAAGNLSPSASFEQAVNDKSFSSNAFIEEIHNHSSPEISTPNQTIQLNPADSQAAQPESQEKNEAQTSPKSLGSSDSSTTEDFQVTISGKIDTNQHFEAQTLETGLGSISYNKQGEWHYTLDNQSDTVQALSAGDSLNDTITLVTKSGSEFDLDITIHGSNDIAILSGPKTAQLNALSNTDNTTTLEELSGKLEIEDRDSGESAFQIIDNSPSTYGAVSVSANGEWSYTLNNQLDAVKGLVAGESLHDLLPIKTVDGTSQLIQITINGSDDRPLLSGVNIEALDLANGTTASQTLIINDPDFGESHFQAQDIIESSSGLGTGSINEGGNWTFEINTDHPTILNLSENENVNDSFFVKTADGTEQGIIVSIIGSNQPIFAQTLDTPETLTATNTIQTEEILLTTQAENELDLLLSNNISSRNEGNDKQTDSLDSANSSTLGSSDSELLQQLTQNNQTTDII